MATSGEHLALHVAQAAPIAQISLADIRVLNPRSRNQQVFARLVENIASLGLKRPITVTRNGSTFDLICGQGRFEAFKVLGESAIPAVVVTAAEADRYLISLVENLARRKHSNRDLLIAIHILHERGYSIRQIAQKTCLDRAYVGGILILLRQGEERLIAAVEKGWLPIKVAIHVARSDDAQVQAAMVEAYESGLLKGDELIKVRRLIDRRRVLGKDYGKHQGGERMTTPRQLLTAYQTEVRRQRLMVKKADISEQRLLFVVTALRRLLADEFFRSMLHSEGIDDMPQVLAERIQGGFMTVIKRAFEPDLITVRLPLILPSRQVTHDMLTSVKYAAILASIRELGVVEPLAVHPEPVHGVGEEPRYLLLDGHLRLAALVQLGAKDALCLLATDDEGFTYNRQINRLTPIQEHKMILEAIRKGTTAERIAEVLSVNVGRIRERQHLLRGIAPEVAEMLKTRMVSQAVFRVLRKMKPMRQIELVEMMISANCFTGRYAEMVLAATRPEQLVEAKKVSEGVTAEDIARMEREMEKLYHDYRLVEDTLGETMLVLVVAKGYVSRMLRNQTIAAYLERFEPDLVRELAGVVEAVTADARSLERE